MKTQLACQVPVPPGCTQWPAVNTRFLPALFTVLPEHEYPRPSLPVKKTRPEVVAGALLADPYQGAAVEPKPGPPPAALVRGFVPTACGGIRPGSPFFAMGTVRRARAWEGVTATSSDFAWRSRAAVQYVLVVRLRATVGPWIAPPAAGARAAAAAVGSAAKAAATPQAASTLPRPFRRRRPDIREHLSVDGPRGAVPRGRARAPAPWPQRRAPRWSRRTASVPDTRSRHDHDGITRVHRRPHVCLRRARDRVRPACWAGPQGELAGDNDRVTSDGRLVVGDTGGCRPLRRRPLAPGAHDHGS